MTYTQSQKNRNIFEVAFLLEKSAYQWMWSEQMNEQMNEQIYHFIYLF